MNRRLYTEPRQYPSNKIRYFTEKSFKYDLFYIGLAILIGTVLFIICLIAGLMQIVPNL